MIADPDQSAVWRIALSAVGLFVLSTFACLAAVATVPAAVLGWDPVVLVSGSMSPALRPGDVVVAEPPGAHRPGPGTVVVFRSGTGEVVTHRIVRVNDDGTFTTRGDANAVDDSTPVPRSALLGIGRLAVPKAGLPAMWLRAGATGRLAGFVAVVAAAVALLSLDTQRPAERRRRERRRSVVARRPRVVTSTPAVVAIAVASIVCAQAAPTSSSAALVAVTSNGPSTFTTAAASCTLTGTEYTLQPSADTSAIEDKPTTNFGTGATIDVKSAVGKNARAYLRFDLPVLPAGCTVASASLTLKITTFRSGRSIQVARAAAPWTEGALTWSNQPGETGPAIAQPSLNGFMAWSVTTQILDSYSSGNHGFVVRDTVESDAGSMQNKFSSREGANPPVLTMVLG